MKGLKNKVTMKSLEKLSGTSKNPFDIRWNFTKFLVDKNGHVVKRYEPLIQIDEIEKDVIELL
jgi:glutathione peroxidase